MRTNLEILLGDWGRWKRGLNDNGLGYPTASAFAKDKVDHGGWGSIVPDIPLVDDDVRRLDGCISKLHPDFRVIVMAHYVWLGYAADKAARLGMRKREFWTQLGHCHRQLAYSVGGKYVVGWEPQTAECVD